MCVAVLVKQNGREDVICESVQELADALNKKPEDVSSDGPEFCLCNAYFNKLGAVKTFEDPFINYLLEV